MKRIHMLALVLLLLPLTVLSQTSDEFDSDRPISAWTWLREDASRWKMQQDALVMYTQAGALNGVLFNNVRNMLLQPVTRTSDVSFETELGFDPYYEYRNAGILYYIDDDNYIRVSRGIYDGHDDIWLEWEVAGVTQFVYASSSQPMMCKLMLSILKDGAFRASWSLDGKDWKHFAQQSIAFPSRPAMVGLQAANGDGMAASRVPTTAVFQYFRVHLSTTVSAAPAAMQFSVGMPHPSPLRAGQVAMVDIHMSHAASVRYNVTDLLGREVAQAEELGVLPAGTQSMTFRVVPKTPGLYLLHVHAGDQRVTRRLVLLR
ncbi:MAG: hypothetical protein M5R41_14045 [Bacteroidia bacterium]|nr:hypothetical protein [Bacteroidia bacterium]